MKYGTPYCKEMRSAMLCTVRKELRRYADKNKKDVLQRFFKTGPGEYAEGDIFLGVTVPHIRKTAREFQQLALHDAARLLQSPVHEERLLALIVLILQFQKGPAAVKNKIYRMYCRNMRFINNWDLVDLSAEHIIGAYLEDKPKTFLTTLARSKNLWERRMAIVATFAYIKKNNFNQTLRIVRLLRDDAHDLIHKAGGWMLREVGKRDISALKGFLKEHYRRMPRTMLRYAIERFSPRLRKKYLAGRL